MKRSLQFVASITLSMGMVSAVAAQPQRPPQRRQPLLQESEPPAEREFTRSRFGEPRTASLPPPIVRKESSAKLESGAAGTGGVSKRLGDPGPLAAKIRPAFDPVDPTDLEALLRPTTVIAIVGGHHIITGDILGDVNMLLPPEFLAAAPEDELAKTRAAYLQQLLNHAIDSKLLYIDFLRQDRATEMMARIKSIADPKFDDQVLDTLVKVIAADSIEAREELNKQDPAFRRIAEMMAREHLSTIGEADLALARYGTSLAKERRRYVERFCGFTVIQNNSKKIEEATREQLAAYYEKHLIDFSRPARSKWEKLSVRHARFPSRAEAREAIAQMGDEVFLRGASLAAVAKRSSQTTDASDGGLHDWTGKDSLRSEVLNRAIFELPVGELSDILEDEEGLHIVRVIERDDGGYEPFDKFETQQRIRKLLKEEQTKAIQEAHFAKLKREIAVWNIFDELPQDADQAGQ